MRAGESGPAGGRPASRLTGVGGESGPSADAAEVNAGLWTLPNALSALRLAGVPLFLWLVLGPEEDAWALAVLENRPYLQRGAVARQEFIDEVRELVVS